MIHGLRQQRLAQAAPALDAGLKTVLNSAAAMSLRSAIDRTTKKGATALLRPEKTGEGACAS
jgi:hypothetical protein